MERSRTLNVDQQLSRDGLEWTRPFRGQRFINPKDNEPCDRGAIFTNSTPIFLGDEIRFYYGAYASGLDKPDAYKKPGANDNRSGVGYASIPLDRFAGIRPMPETRHPTLKEPLQNIGQVTLKPLDLTGRSQLLVNADAGSIRVELLNELGYRLHGFTRDDAKPLTGDSLRQVASWNDKQLKDLPSGKYQIRVHLDNAELFAATIR